MLSIARPRACKTAPAICVRVRIVSFAAIVLAFGVACSGAESESVASDATNEIPISTTSQELGEDPEFRRETGPWESLLYELDDNDKAAEPELDIAALTIAPMVYSASDLQRHLLGTSFSADTSRERIQSLMYQTFQQVPGVPLDPRYQDDRFDIIRRGFSQQCQDAAGGYGSLLTETFLADDEYMLDVVGDVESTLAASSYEAACLTPLPNIPLDIRRVLGLLAVDGAPFCSATIIGQQNLITSRHCFVDPSTGLTLASVQHWKDGNLSFVSAVKHNGRQSFKVREPTEAELAQISGSYLAVQDFWLITTTRQLQYTANYEHPPEAIDQYPIPAWLVGSNMNLDDFGDLKSPLEFIRGSAPTACAVLEKTDAGCIYHTCQSSLATSGAGLLVSDAINGVKLLGVHKGTIAEAGSCEAMPPISLRLNMGITGLSILDQF